MVQDIGEGRFHCEYRPERPAPEDALIAVRGGELLLTESGGVYDFPRVSQLETISRETERPYYLFSIDGNRFFLCRTPVTEAPEGMVFRHLMQLRLLFADDWRVFAGATAWHLGDWYASRRYCGACGAPAEHKADERAMVCPVCGRVEYPKIAPVVIVAVTDGEELLLTRYANRGGYRRHALIAGFVEIGEAPEDAVRREVMEEVGLHVKNLRYFDSQPWGFSGSMLNGFFAELDGSRKVKVDETELAEAVWFKREDLPMDDGPFSLTWTMIKAFHEGREKEGRKG